MKRKKILSIALLLTGLTFSVWFYVYSSTQNRNYIHQKFNLLAEIRYLEIKDSIENHLTILHAVALYFESSDSVSREQFSNFTKPLMYYYPNIQALEWIPRIKDKDRDVFELAIQKAGFSNFEIKEKLNNQIIRRKRAKEYFPVNYIEPFAGNEKAFGYDLNSNPIRRAALITVRDNYINMLSSARIELVQEKARQNGFLVFYPVFKKNTVLSNIASRQKNLKGFTLAVFRIGDMINESIKGNMELQVFDVTKPEKPEKLYLSIQHQVSLLSYKKQLNVAGRIWELVFIPSSAFLKEHENDYPFIWLFSGIVFSLLLSAFVFNLVNKKEQIENEVKIQTRELLESEAQVRAIFNTTVNGIITINNKGIILSFNPAAEMMFGYAVNEIIGENVRILMPEPYSSMHDQYITNYRKSRVPKIMGEGREVTGKRKNGSVFPLYLSVGEILTDSHQQFVGTFIDNTKRKKADLALIKAKEQAEIANRLKSEFLNTMSHELRTPLTVILGNIEELLEIDELPDPDDIVDISQDVYKSGNHLLALINDLLDLSKIEAGKLDFAFEKVDIDGIIDEAINTIKPLAKDKALSLQYEKKSNIFVRADPLRLKQVLLNLLSNAIKFTQEGFVDISVIQNNKMVEIKVTDTGSGMEVGDLEYIFDPFRQVDNSMTRKVGGTGLGLAITKKITEMHGGQISVESQIGKGSSFIFSIPIFYGEIENESKDIDS